MEEPSLKSSDSAEAVEHFECNICGTPNRAPASSFGREVGNCARCGSTVRTRGVIHMLSREFFGRDLTLPQFPVIKGLRGIGMSDSPDYAYRLSDKFSYTNTFFHKEPQFDITHVSESDWGSYDFLISSEVFEHVAPPVEIAFQNAFRLLKPNGLFFFTVPYTIDERPLEHFPELYEYAITSLGNGHVLVNRTREGQVQVYEDLLFHGGPGETLEMRRLNERELLAQFERAGFRAVEIYGRNFAPFGILRTETWSLPMTARKEPFTLRPGCFAEVIDDLRQVHAQNRKWNQRVVDQEHWMEWAKTEIARHEHEVEVRTKWALDMEAQLKERTEWALNMEKDLTHHVELAKRFQAESNERTVWALQLQAQVDVIQRRLSEIKSSKWVKAGRVAGLVKE